MESSSSSYSSSSPTVPSSPRYASYRPSQRLFRYDFDEEGDDGFEPRHFLDSCSLCGKPLARNRDIFMYKGDTPFCSEECRQEQIDADEAMEKKWKHSAKGRKGQQQQEEIRVRARSTTVAG